MSIVKVYLLSAFHKVMPSCFRDVDYCNCYYVYDYLIVLFLSSIRKGRYTLGVLFQQCFEHVVVMTSFFEQTLKRPLPSTP